MPAMNKNKGKFTSIYYLYNKLFFDLFNIN